MNEDKMVCIRCGGSGTDIWLDEDCKECEGKGYIEPKEMEDLFPELEKMS